MRTYKIKRFASAAVFVLFTAGCGPSGSSSEHVLGQSPDKVQDAFSLSKRRDGNYLIGTGMGDVTGPLVGLATMGYAAPAAETSGLHQRLWARAFVIADPDTPDDRLVYVVSDLCFVSAAVKAAVVQKLTDEFGSLYDHANIMLTATHTHSGPGAFSAHHMYNVPSGGFSPENFAIIVDGIASAIRQADSNLEPGSLNMATGSLTGLSRNRSLLAYERNPQQERDGFAAQTDSEVTLLRFDAENGEPRGLAHWFAVHATSINKNNNLVSGDNKGYAAWRFEQEMGRSYLDDSGFVAAFANSNAGDASPNVAGDVDDDGDWECAANENFACAKWSGEGHYSSALDLFETASQSVTGSLRKAHRFVDFSNITLNAGDGPVDDAVTTCESAIGVSMLAGSAEDGPGVGEEGTSCSTGGLIARRRCSRERFQCHGEKPVALATGSLGHPTWTPNILPTQIFVIGNVALVGVPSEFTTMAGRRLRSRLRESLADVGVERVVIAGYANAYSNYVATQEEYQAQHYEGASTLFGEHTLAAYELVYAQLSASLAGADVPAYEPQPEFVLPSRTAELPNAIDRAPGARPFGDVVEQPLAEYQREQTAEATFQGANLNHSLGRIASLLEIQHLREGEWTSVAYDWDFSTRLYWQDTGSGTSTVRIEWDIPSDAATGTYRMVYHGVAKTSGPELSSFDGYSATFFVR